MSRTNGTVYAVPGPGQVDAFCTFCTRDVVIAEGTMACPHCGQDVNPLSLPTVPDATRAAVVALPSVQMAPVAPKPVEAPARLTQPPSAPKSPPRPVTLPNLPGVLEWFGRAASVDELLAEHERSLTARIGRIRAEIDNVKRTRYLLAQLDERIEVPELDDQAPAVVTEIAVETLAIEAPAPQARVAEPEPSSLAPRSAAIATVPIGEVAARVNGHETGPKRWAREWDACRNCGTSDRTTPGTRHNSFGRCASCDSYWREHKKLEERPVSRD